jgi:hypothetical protein
MYGRFMLGRTLMAMVAIKVTVVAGAFLTANSADDDHYLRMAHELHSTPGMPEPVLMRGANWVVLAYPPADVR